MIASRLTGYFFYLKEAFFNRNIAKFSPYDIIKLCRVRRGWRSLSNLKVWFKSGETVTFENVRAFYLRSAPPENTEVMSFYYEDHISQCDVPANIETSRVTTYKMIDM